MKRLPLHSAPFDVTSEDGLSLIEIMVSILLIAIISLGVAKNLVGALQTAKFTEVNHAASSLAISKMEELAAIDTSLLASSHGGTENEVAWPDLDITFRRVTTVTANADGSRTVEVIVSSNSEKVATTVEFQNIFAAWE